MLGTGTAGTTPDKDKLAEMRSGASCFEAVDVQAAMADKPQEAVRVFVLSGKPEVVECDILIVGGGMGGVAAALSAARPGLTVCLTEETDWLGGQMTSQGVSALDENYLVETSGACRSYQQLRGAIRRHYRACPGISPQCSASEYLNPGNCWVSRLSFEPAVALAKLDELLRPALADGLLRIFLRWKPVSVKVIRGRVKSVLMVHLESGAFKEFRPRICLDATELGELLPLAGVPFSCGAESKDETHELHAPEAANPENVQDFVFPFVVEFRPGESHIISKPPHYEDFRAAGKFSFFGYKMFAEVRSLTEAGKEVCYLPFWEYRRLVARDNFPQSDCRFDLSMINWESNDLRGENIIDKPAKMVAYRLALAKDLSLGFLFWLQTEARRDDGGVGYPELLLRRDVLGTRDGLSMYPYIRESRRIKARRIVKEVDIAFATTSGARARLFPDAVGIGFYPIDIHGHQDVPGAGQSSRPFQIPLGALVQDKVRNLIPACKNIGTTHVTNGAYRLHPVEWALGESAGIIAAFCRQANTHAGKILNNKRRLREVQRQLIEQGSPVFWFDDVATDHPFFAAIQFLSITAIMKASAESLHFRPEEPVSRAEAAAAFSRLLKLKEPASGMSFQSGEQPSAQERCRHLKPADVEDGDPEFEAIMSCLKSGLLTLRASNCFCSDAPLSASELASVSNHSLLQCRFTAKTDEVTITRAQFAGWLYKIATRKKYFGSV